MAYEHKNQSRPGKIVVALPKSCANYEKVARIMRKLHELRVGRRLFKYL